MWSEAETMHGNLPLGDEEESNYAYLAGLAIDLYSNDKNWDSLDCQTKDTIQGMIAENSMSGYFAGGICEYLGIQNTIWPLPVYDTAEYDAYERKGKGAEPGMGPGPGKKEYGFSLYPNPTNGNFIVKAKVAGRLILYNQLGQKMAEYRTNEGETQLNIPVGMISGIYIGKYVSDKDGTIETMRLLYQQ